MTTPQQFGEYLLFRRLTTDGLGETYRAGKIGNQGIERVVLLRLFNGQGLDADTLWRTIADRMGLHRILQNPHIGDGADVGRVGTTPYVAYEYVSGKNLAELLDQARARAFQIPTEHALFIMERVTFGLSAAFSTRHREQRVQHGFLIPENVLLSNEGEVRLIGFESAPGLREFLTAAPIRDAFGSFLAPEVRPGTHSSSTDDVFSLGSLMYELLTGNRLVHPQDGNCDPLVDEAMLASEEQPLPPSLRALLKSSLAPKANRIGDVQQWQQAFSRFISEADYSPTTFNLAFFMHNLFGGEIEQETVDIAREKATQVDVASLAQAQVQTPTPGPSDTVLVPPEASPKTSDASIDTAGVGQYGAAGRKETNWKLLAALAVIAIAGGLGAAYYWTQLRGPAVETDVADASTMPATESEADLVPEGADDIDGELLDATLGEEAATAIADDPILEDAVDATGVDVPATPEEVESQIEQLVADRANTLEAQYQDQLDELRAQLEQARQAQEQAGAGDGSSAGDPRTGDPTTADPTSEGDEPAQVARTSAQGAAQSPAARPGGSTSPPSSETATNPPVDSQPSGAEAEESQAAETETEPVQELPPPRPVSLGDIVSPGAGVTPPEMIDRPKPRYPPGARRLGKEATVQLRLLVDENGGVEQVETTSAPAGFGFDDAALAAAKRTKWRPATKNGVRVKMWVDLKIAFRP